MKGRNFTPHRQLNPLIPLPTGQCTLTLVLICDQCALGNGRLIKRTSSEGKWQFMSVPDAFCHLSWVVWLLCWARGIRGVKNASFTCYQVDAFVRIQILISVTNARSSQWLFCYEIILQHDKQGTGPHILIYPGPNEVTLSSCILLTHL